MNLRLASGFLAVGGSIAFAEKDQKLTDEATQFERDTLTFRVLYSRLKNLGILPKNSTYSKVGPFLQQLLRAARSSGKGDAHVTSACEYSNVKG